MTNNRQIALPSLTMESAHEKQAKVKNYMLQSKLDKVLGLLQTEEQIYLQIFRKEKHVVEVAKSKILFRLQLSNCNPANGDQLLSPPTDGKEPARHDSKIPRSQSMPDARHFATNESKRLPRLDRRPVQRLMELIVPDESRRIFKQTSTAPTSCLTGNSEHINYKQSKSINVEFTKTDRLSLRVDNCSAGPHFCPPSPRPIFSNSEYAAHTMNEQQPMDLEENNAGDVDVITTNSIDGIPVILNDTRTPLSIDNDLSNTSHNRVIPRPSSASCGQFRYANEIGADDGTHSLRSRSATVIVGTTGCIQTGLRLPKVNCSRHTNAIAKLDTIKSIRERHEFRKTDIFRPEEDDTVYSRNINDEGAVETGNMNRRKLSLKRRRESVFPASVQNLKNELREMADERAEQLKKRFDFDKAIAREKQGFKDVVKRVDDFFVQMHHSGMLHRFTK